MDRERVGQPGGHPDAGGISPTQDEQNWQPPWPEDLLSGSLSPERAKLVLEFAAGIRRAGSLMQMMSQAAADKIGINATDLNCMNILSFSGQMTAGELARATGLTTASITGVVDRLEEAGFVRRERDSVDRRRVVIKLNVERALSSVAPVFRPMMGAWSRMAEQYTDEELALIVEFHRQIQQVFRDHLARLRESSGRGDDLA
jgi:DNA-binding transcriptional ArsR family regulator